jgi:hypothetical protein
MTIQPRRSNFVYYFFIRVGWLPFYKRAILLHMKILSSAPDKVCYGEFRLSKIVLLYSRQMLTKSGEISGPDCGEDKNCCFLRWHGEVLQVTSVSDNPADAICKDSEFLSLNENWTCSYDCHSTASVGIYPRDFCPRETVPDSSLLHNYTLEVCLFLAPIQTHSKILGRLHYMLSVGSESTYS